MAIQTRNIEYRHSGILLEGVLAFESASTAKRPGILVLHGWEGRSEPQIAFAKELARWGYVGFAVDLYGKGVSPTTSEERQKLMAPFLEDRPLLQDRLLYAVDVVKNLPEVESDRLAAVGFCFGGLCALDLARTGAALRAVASFHGILTPPGNTTGTKIRAKVIAFHGWQDPFAPPDHLIALGRELTDSDADWQIHAYGKTMHAFMAPDANSPEAGIMYNEVSARRALASLKAFLPEAFATELAEPPGHATQK
jgi:dienelactone hydrolase